MWSRGDGASSLSLTRDDVAAAVEGALVRERRARARHLRLQAHERRDARAEQRGQVVDECRPSVARVRARQQEVLWRANGERECECRPKGPSGVLQMRRRVYAPRQSATGDARPSSHVRHALRRTLIRMLDGPGPRSDCILWGRRPGNAFIARSSRCARKEAWAGMLPLSQPLSVS
jgi:hypothetical protein